MSPQPDSVLDIKPGDVLAGKYRVERILGSGGMGIVVAAHHLQLDERVALKFLLPSAIGSMDVIARFMREARTTFKIKSEHVARVTDVGQLENGSPYIVMEYLEGGDLAAWLVQRGAMPIEQGIDFILQACEALAEAHVLGIVHRDLKPANLFCVQRADGLLSIKVLDFGISKVMNQGQQAQAMTRTNGLVGSPLYMSPEHMKSSRTVDARADLWSLGVILFELIAGRPPFEAEAVTELVLKVAAEPPIPLRRFRPDAPAELEAVIIKCLEKDREKRYQTVGDLAMALEPFGPAHGRASVDRIVGTMERAAAAGPLRPSLDQSSSELQAVQPMRFDGADRSTRPPEPVPGVPLIAGLSPQSHPSMPLTTSSFGQGEPDGVTSGKAVVGLALGTAVAVVAVVFAIAWPRLTTPPPGPASDVAEGSLSAAAPPRPASTGAAAVVASAAAAASSSPTVTNPPVIDIDSEPIPASAHPAGHPVTGQTTPQHHPTASPARNTCNPPYYIDGKGTHHYKPECI